MYQEIQSIGLYGNLVPQYHRNSDECFSIQSPSRTLVQAFQPIKRAFITAIGSLFDYPCVQHLQLTFFVAAAALILVFPLSGRAEEITEAAFPAVTKLLPAEKPDSIEPPEKSNATAQSTWIVAEHGSFRSPYVGSNSLLPKHENAYTWTISAYLGFRPFANTEIYFDPELIQSNQFSGLYGLGAFNNNENQKMGDSTPTFYRVRLFARQTWNLDGEKLKLESDTNQLAGVVDRDRVVLTVGNVSTPDVFNNNMYAHDARTKFLNWALLPHIASDFAVDARGHTWRVALEYYKGN